MSSSARSDGVSLEPLLVVVGPTASGKTELAVRLAESCRGEIVSADSVQIYRGFDVGSGKPSADELLRAPHHLIDITDPDQPLDAAQWATLAASTIDEIRARGGRPFVCGGTFLWVRALIHGLAEAPGADPAIRQRHTELAERDGRAALHEQLAQVDPTIAAKLNPNDFVRVSRALEVWELTGVRMSDWQARHGFREQRYDARLIGIRRTREELDQRIRERVTAMLRAGWIDEVRALLASGYASSRAMGSVGYRQIAYALANEAPIDEAELLESIVRATRVFARRQRTWLRDQPVLWLEPNELAGADPAALLRRIEAVRG